MNLSVYNRSLPLLAAALSDQRNIRVAIGGSQAFTDGRTIHLPSLPLNADDSLLGVARGYLDHESAHVLFSEFNALTSAKLTPLEQFFANAIEDVRIENLMAERYLGSRENLRHTARHVFIGNANADTNADPSFAVPGYVLLRLRSQACPELGFKTQEAATVVALYFPGLITQLEPVFSEIQSCCPDTAAAIHYGKRIASLLKAYQKPQTQTDAQGENTGDSGNADHSASDGTDITQNSCKALAANAKPEKADAAKCSDSSLAPLFADDAADRLPSDLGKALSDELAQHAEKDPSRILTTAVEVPAAFQPMPATMRNRTAALEASLRPHLRGVLQADTFEGIMPATQGRLNSRKLYSVPFGNAYVFTRRVPKRLTSTAVHILLDKSGSTMGFIEQATMSAYAVAAAAQSIPGVNVGMSAFPARFANDADANRPGITTLLRHGQRQRELKSINASGSTPLAEAIYHVLPQLLRQQETRKILLVFTDGVPDSRETAELALRDAKALGMEIYAVSYRDVAAKRLFGEQNCAVIASIDELPGAFTNMLLGALRRAA